MELDHKLIESTEDGDLMLALNADTLLRKSHTQKQNQHKRHRERKLQEKQVELMCLVWTEVKQDK